MKLIAASLMTLSLLASACAGANQERVASSSYARAAASSQDSQKLTITRSGSHPSRQAPAEYFTGSVRIDPLFSATPPSRASGSYVTFEPGARSAWHTHPLGQTLIVTAGTGWVQQESGERQEIKPGDVIWTPPGVKHWHGATANNGMTHIAIQGAVGGKNVDWREKVTEEEYKMAAHTKSNALSATPTLDDVRMVAPVLERYTQNVLVGDLWKRPDLSARSQPNYRGGSDRAQSNAGVSVASQPGARERRQSKRDFRGHYASRVLLRLGECDGGGCGRKRCLRLRGIGVDQLPPAEGPLLPIDEASEARRAAFVEESVGPVAPGIVHYTSKPLFHELWLRAALTPRDRSLVTVSALVAAGQVAQLSAHLNRAMDNGLTKSEASEALTHLLFYAGWPNVFSAIPVAKDVFEKRPG